VEQMCKNLSLTKTRRGNCLVLPHTGYALGNASHTGDLVALILKIPLTYTVRIFQHLNFAVQKLVQLQNCTNLWLQNTVKL